MTEPKRLKDLDGVARPAPSVLSQTEKAKATKAKKAKAKARKLAAVAAGGAAGAGEAAGSSSVSSGWRDEMEEESQGSPPLLSSSREERRQQKAADSSAATKSQLVELERRLPALEQWLEAKRGLCSTEGSVSASDGAKLQKVRRELVVARLQYSRAGGSRSRAEMSAAVGPDGGDRNGVFDVDAYYFGAEPEGGMQ